MVANDKYWEKCWQEENIEELYTYLEKYNKCSMQEIEIFKEHHITKVCDAACGFGAYSLAFASSGFEVHSFDISETAVEIAKAGLKKYGIDPGNVKVASITDTKYSDETFGGVIAHAVIDHLMVSDARKALEELLRITKKDGLIMLSFDTAEDEDFATEHIMVENGTMEYTDSSREGMLFHPYEWEEVENFIQAYDVIYKATNSKNEKIVIIKK